MNTIISLLPRVCILLTKLFSEHNIIQILLGFYYYILILQYSILLVYFIYIYLDYLHQHTPMQQQYGDPCFLNSQLIQTLTGLTLNSLWVPIFWPVLF